MFPVGTFDLVTVPPSTWHQFRASTEAPLGFLCMVDAERDKPELPDARELERLRGNPARARSSAIYSSRRFARMEGHATAV